MKNFFKSKYLITICLALILLIMILISQGNYERKKSLVYNESLEMTAAEVNGVTLTLADVAFYVYYEENEVDKQAVVYNADNPNEYWGSYTDGQFIKLAARNAAIQMAIHDEIFYQMAMKEEIILSEEELSSLANNQTDVWSDMTEDGKEKRLGVSKEQVDKTLEKMAYAQKYQTIYALSLNASYEDYNFAREQYGALLEEQDYKINKDVWERIPFGKVTLDYEVEE